MGIGKIWTLSGVHDSNRPLSIDWNIIDTNEIITVDDAKSPTAMWGVNGSYQGAEHSVRVDAGSLFWTGNFELRYRIRYRRIQSFSIRQNTGLQQLIGNPTEIVADPGIYAIVCDLMESTIYDTFQITEYWGGGGGWSQNNTMPWDETEDIWQYVKLYRTGSDYGIKNYGNDATFTTVYSEYEEALNYGIEAYRYLYVFNAIDQGPQRNVDFDIQIISITPSPW